MLGVELSQHQTVLSTPSWSVQRDSHLLAHEDEVSQDALLHAEEEEATERERERGGH
jgi:hypothetical protein